jgi:uncharacterized membrane protein
MEGLLVLLGLALLAIGALAPVLAIVALARSSHAQSQLDALRRDLTALDTRLAALIKITQAARTAASLPVEPPLSEGTREMPAAAKPAGEETGPVHPELRAPTAAAVSEALLPSVPPASGGALSPPPPPEAPRPTAHVARPATAAPPLSRPVLAPRPVPPSSASFDWESLLGLRGAAWLGGIALVIGAALLAKWALDENLITPSMRIATLILMGTTALVVAELSLRRGYETTANAVSGAGIAILYIAFFAGRSVYGLFSPALTFGLMSLVTVVACTVAIRYDALFTAILGLLGGFATPIIVSTGADHPVALFSYIFILNIGLLAVALHKRWHGLIVFALGATVAIELSWYARFMSPQKAFVGLSVFLVFGLLYVLLPLTRRTQDEKLVVAGAAGGAAPFLFALLIAGQSSYAAEWPLLFAFIGLLDAALVLVGTMRRRPELLIGAGLATAVFLPSWAAQNLRESSVLWGPTLAAVAIVAVLNLAQAAARRIGPASHSDEARVPHAAGLLAGVGLGLFALVLIARDLGEPPWPFLALVAALTCVLVARSGAGRLPGALGIGVLALAVLIQTWFFATTHESSLLRNLSVALLLALTLALVTARRARTRTTSAIDVEEELAPIVATGVAVIGLFGCLASEAFGSEPQPLFAALAVAMALVVVSALRSGWTLIVPVGLCASALFATAWHTGHFHPADLPTALAAYGIFYLAFLAVPFVASLSERPGIDRSGGLWIASALAGPLFFYPLYRALSDAWGTAFIGALPVLMAGLTVVALRGVSERFVAGRSDERAARDRLRYLALFAAVALGFIALAIPLQLDRQWITIGWALEAMAVFWLFGRLPHPGLRLFGTILFGAVGVRLLVNPEVLHYQPRGLPIVNWLLYTYGVPALCCFLGARFLRSAEERQRGDSAAPPRRLLVPAVGLLGLLLVFALINLEIADYFGQGTYLELSWERRHDRDLATSAAWGLYAIALLVIGIWRRVRALRYVGLGFLILTVGKVFLYDLSHLTGMHRILSFFGLGIALVLVSLIYQRFVVSAGESR